MPHSNGISELLDDISKLPKIELPLNCTFGPEQLISSILYPEQRTKGVVGNGCTPHERESSITKLWTEKLTELRKFLYPSDPDTKNSTEEFIPAHELLHMVIGVTSNECHHSSSTRILIMILACHAVRVSVDVDPKRWKRIQSMTLECIAHFQRNFLDFSEIHGKLGKSEPRPPGIAETRCLLQAKLRPNSANGPRGARYERRSPNPAFF